MGVLLLFQLLYKTAEAVNVRLLDLYEIPNHGRIVSVMGKTVVACFERFAIEGELGYGFFGVLATMMYGTSVNTLKTNLPHLKALTITTLSLATAAPFTITFSLLSGVTEVFKTDPNAWTNFGYIAVLGILGSGIAVIIFNRLIQITTALFSSSVTYAIPVVAILWGIWDDEHILWNHLLGLGVIITGIYLVNRRK